MKIEHLKLAACVLAGSMLLAMIPTLAKGESGAAVTGYITGQENLFTAGAHSAISETVVLNDENQMLASGVKENDTPQVGDQIDDSDAMEETEQSEYANIAITQVEIYLNIRAEANEEAEVLGKLYNSDAAVVLETLDGWYKVTSGSVTGYIAKDYVVVGDEELCKKVSQRVGTVMADILKFRREPSIDSEPLTLLVTGKKLTILDESIPEWYKVTDGNYTGYVASRYVQAETQYSYAESIEEEAARLAAEEAARKAEEAKRKEEEKRKEEAKRKEEEKKAQAQAQNKKPAQAKPDKQYQAPAGTNGQSVADFACQFVGNPYVWGGESLTNGADCSGFVKAVYAKFGVNLPHSSLALRSSGYAVSEAEMKPGDLVCYSGHVGIYIGNGKLVHASNEKDGIKISNYNYREILAIRRIF